MKELPGGVAQFGHGLHQGGERSFEILGVFDTIAADECDVFGHGNSRIAQAAIDSQGDVVRVAENCLGPPVFADVILNQLPGDRALVLGERVVDEFRFQHRHASWLVHIRRSGFFW